MKKLLLFLVALRLVVWAVNIRGGYWSLEQDNYVKYVQRIKIGKLSEIADDDKRLFPGYPVAIWVLDLVWHNSQVSGLIISLGASCGTAIFLNKLFRANWPGWLVGFFPPVWIKSGARIATEPLFVMLETISLYFWVEKKYFWAGALVGLAFLVRPVGMVLLVTYIIFANRKKDLIFGFLTTAMLLLVFNGMMFGSNNILEQFMHGERYGMRFGVLQLMQDFWRTWAWGQYRILASGSFYILVNVLSLGALFRNFKKSKLVALMAVWMTLGLIYVLSFSPYTLIDDFGRYSLAFLPALVMGLKRMCNPTANMLQAKRQRTA